MYTYEDLEEYFLSKNPGGNFRTAITNALEQAKSFLGFGTVEEVKEYLFEDGEDDDINDDYIEIETAQKDWSEILEKKVIEGEEFYALPRGAGVELLSERIYREPRLKSPNYFLPKDEIYLSLNTPSLPLSLKRAIRGLGFYSEEDKVPKNITSMIDKFHHIDGIYIPYKKTIIHRREIEQPENEEDIVISILAGESDDEEEKETSSSSVQIIDERFATDIGKRDENEDGHITGTIEVDGVTVRVWGVFDGHGGDAVAKYIESNYLQRAENYLNENISLSEYDLNEMNEDFEEQIAKILKKFHIEFDWEIIRRVDDESGATATVLYQIGNYLIIVNAGDSRTVLYRHHEVLLESIDHKPDNKDEKERAKKAGFLVSEGRVWGEEIGLAVSRGFGDREFKKNNLKQLKTSPVSPEPNIFFHFLTPGEKVEVVIGCDGVWDVLESKDGLDVIKKAGRNISQAIRDIIKKGSTDNVSIIYLKMKCE